MHILNGGSNQNRINLYNFKWPKNGVKVGQKLSIEYSLSMVPPIQENIFYYIKSSIHPS